MCAATELVPSKRGGYNAYAFTSTPLHCITCNAYGTIISDHGQGFNVCTACGVCQTGRIAEFCYSMSLPARRSIYKRVHHLHERLAQWTCQEPKVPDELLGLILDEIDTGKYGDKQTIEREAVISAIRAVEVPQRLQEKYRSTKFKKLPMRNLRRYMERWRSIQQRVRGKPLEQPTQELLDNIKRGFVQMQINFEMFRHSKACNIHKKNYGTRPRRCHKNPLYKCRHNFPNMNFVILQLIERYGGEDERKKWEPVFPQISNAKRRRLMQYWQAMKRKIGWK